MSSAELGGGETASRLWALKAEWQYLAAAAAVGSVVGYALGIVSSARRSRSSRQISSSSAQLGTPKLNGKGGSPARPDPREAKLMKNPAMEIKMVLCVRMVSSCRLTGS